MSPCGLGEILAIAGVSNGSDQISFAEQFCRNEAAMPSFWSSLTETSFDKPRLQLTFQWWSLTRGHLPLLQALEARRVARTEETLVDLAKFSEADWTAILDTLPEGAPPSIPGTSSTDRKANYARVLRDTMATAFPTRAFGKRVLFASVEPSSIQSFFETAHPTFEFGKHRLSRTPYKSTVDAMSADHRKRIKAMERLFRFAPQYEHVGEMLAKGYDSAHAVHAAGKSRFVEEMLPTLGAATAEKVFTRACWHAGASNVVFAQFGLATHKVPSKAFANFTRLSQRTEAQGNQIPDYQTLFGSAGGCSCSHCAGVLGAAAYLTDSLVWLDSFSSEITKVGTKKWSALDILVGSTESGATPPAGRRPDLELLELTCKSAHTSMPYIDIANEILELAVAKDAGLTVDLGISIKSSHEPEELAAGPEILYEQPHIRAWRSLMERRHPFTLPVCLFDRESDAYLGYLGVTRADIVQALPVADDDMQKRELAKARLHVRDDVAVFPNQPLLSGWRMLLATENTGTAQEHWGGKTTADLRSVPTLLAYAGLTFPELEELLATRYVNGVSVNGVSVNGAASLPALRLFPALGCDTATMTIPALGDAHLLRLHRFLRLRLHTGLSSTDLDLLLAAFSADPNDIEISTVILQNVTGAQSLAKELRLTVREVAALFADLDIHERWEKRSPYRKYFLNRLVDSPASTVFTAVLAVPESTANLSLHRTALQQGLGISEKELRLLVDAATLAAELLLPPGECVVSDLDTEAGTILDRISSLWRTVRFARALGLSVADYLVLRAYSGLTPIGTAAAPSDAQDFVDLVRDWKTQQLNMAELQWVLRAFAPPSTGLGPQGADVEALRAEITSAVGVLQSETETTEDPADPNSPPTEGEGRAFTLLGELLWDEALLYANRDAVFQVLQGSDNPPTDGTWRGAIDLIARYLPGNVDGAGGAKDLLAGPFATPVHGQPFLRSSAERFAYVAKWLDRHLRGSRTVVEKMAAATTLPIATVTHLVTKVVRSHAAPAEHTLLDDFLPANKPDANAEHQRIGLGLLLRHARLLSGLGVGDPIPPPPDAPPGTSDNLGELAWVYPEPPVSPGLHDLPAAQPNASFFGVDDRGRFGQVLKLARRIRLRGSMAGGAHALREILDASSLPLPEAQLLLAEKSGWDLGVIQALGAHFQIDQVSPGLPTNPHSLLDDTNLLKLEKGVALVRRLGLAPEAVLAFLNLESKPPAAVALGLQPTTGATRNARDLVIFARHAAKAKLSTEEWAEVAKKVRDPFRELQRDRLVDALVPKLHATRNDLYGFHLIDVDMSACMMTSRIVQATNAVQVFVQRAFLGLDDDVKLPQDAAKQWEWRKSYRVWEANRKVFLWPENWLEPELRDDMTPLFRDFQTHLASGEITDASAERALEKYLSGLQEIARLEPMALAYEAETGTDHVLARTRGQPSKWFYRRRERDLVWTAWEKVDVDIDAESALLVAANHRLYVFWPQVALKNDPRVAPSDPATTDSPPPVPPIKEADESWDSYFEKKDAWWSGYTDWKKSQSEGEEQPAEQAQRFEVRVAWSSRVDGAWTSRRLSDGSPVIVLGAKGEVQTGYEPKHIVLSLEPQSEGQSDGEVRLLCVATPWFPLQSNITAGRFYFDVCGGGRWTSKQLATEPPVTYEPTTPENGRLSRMGFEQFGGTGLVRIPHVPSGQKEPKSVDLLADHAGQFTIVSPASYAKKPTHFFDRFTLDDTKRVLFARSVRTATPWMQGASVSPGQQADVQSADDKLVSADIVFGWAQSQIIQLPTETEDRYAFELFEHPYVCDFERRLATEGVSGLLGWKDDPQDAAQFRFEDISGEYSPTSKVVSFPKQEVSFELGSAYGTYNWELFFHIPFTVAQRLSEEGRYAEAQKWFHFIFNPTSGLPGTSPKRFWCVKPFYDIDDIDTIQQDMSALAAKSSFAAALQAFVAAGQGTQKAADEMRAQIAAVSEQPFAPHVLARMRPLAYMKNVFMRYLQNLLDWADSLFRRDTMESIHEALTLYLLAADLLGPRPDLLEHKADPVGKTFKELLADGIDAFGNAAVDVEPIVTRHPPVGFKWLAEAPQVPDFRLYFCIPPNDRLLGYWDTVADRLFKIRNCMNIEGVVRDLALFAPPIDPAILVRAFAAGVRLDQVLDALAAPSPLYRFVRLHAKAVEFASAVKELGQAVLSAVERKDGEELALLRQRHELAVLDAEREVRKQAIQEAKETLAGLGRSREIAELRRQYYTDLIDKGLLQQERDAESNTRTAKTLRQAAAQQDLLGSAMGAVPDVAVGIAAASTIGGRALEHAIASMGRQLTMLADSLNTDASLAQTAGGYVRRLQEWKLQKSIGEKEIAQLDKQIAAQEIKLAMAERDLQILDLRRDQARDVDTFFRTKFTNQDLYAWMKAQLAGEHYRAYQTAFDMAKRAERAYQLERGDEGTTFVRFGAWDSLKQGLLAGERLLQDLRALDAAYLSRSEREREITKHVSLSEIAGEELTKLRDTGAPASDLGKAVLELHTYHFDADYPGHYFRRLKHVALSVATVKPAADGVQCDLVLLQSSYRKASQIGSAPYPGDPYGDDLHRFSTAAVKALSTSTAENDPGLFEVSLKDEMLLPFEGSGVVSKWRIEIDHRTNRFPMHRISDVVLHLRYTAKDGGAGLRGAALDYAQRAETPDPDPGDPPSGLVKRTRVFSARRDFDEAWAVFTTGTLLASPPALPDSWVNRLELRLAQRHFRSFFGSSKVKIVRVQVSVTYNEKYLPENPSGSVEYTLTPPGVSSMEGALDFRDGEPSALHTDDPDAPSNPLSVPVWRDDEDAFAPWIFEVAAAASTPAVLRVEANHNLLRPDAFEDIWFTVTYEKRS